MNLEVDVIKGKGIDITATGGLWTARIEGIPVGTIERITDQVGFGTPDTVIYKWVIHAPGKPEQRICDGSASTPYDAASELREAWAARDEE
jgi:hypothetical protein